MNRRIAAVARWGLAGLLLAGGLGCEDAPAVSARVETATAVSVEELAVRPVTPVLVVPGVVEARARIELAFRVAGFVERFHVEEGDRVEAGAILAELDADDLAREVRAARAAVARAKAHAADAERALARQEALLARDTTSRRAHDRALSTSEMASAELSEARVRLEAARDRHGKAVLRAPISGVVERRLLEAHESATAASPVLVLVQLDPVDVRAAVADTEASKLVVGGAAMLRTPLWPGRSFAGTISRVDVAADRATRTVPFEIELANPDGALRPELAMEVEVLLGEPESLLLVPTSAVLRDTDATPFVFVLGGAAEAPHASRRPVVLGALHGERVEAREGLVVGDRLVTRGQHFVRDGERVRVVEGEAP